MRRRGKHGFGEQKIRVFSKGVLRRSQCGQEACNLPARKYGLGQLNAIAQALDALAQSMSILVSKLRESSRVASDMRVQASEFGARQSSQVPGSALRGPGGSRWE